MPDSLDSIEREFLLEGVEDYVGLWEFSPAVRRHLNEQDPEKVRDISMMLVRRLIGQEVMVAGDLAEEGGFAPWSCSAEESIDRIGELWRRLGRDPNLGDDIPWFDLTPKGESIAKRLMQ